MPLNHQNSQWFKKFDLSAQKMAQIQEIQI
jgi:hypothetical protein